MAPGLWLGGVPGLQVPVDGFGVSGPAGESCPRCGDIGLAEPDAANVVFVIWSSRSRASAKSRPARPRSSRPGKPDQLAGTVALQRSDHVRVIPRLDAAGQRAHLPGYDVFQVHDRGDSRTPRLHARSRIYGLN
jgi:hypothetical protein